MKRIIFLILALFTLNTTFAQGENFFDKGVQYYETENYTEAFKYFKLAAEQGNADAQYSLRNSSEGGNGIDKNGDGWSIKGRTAKAIGKPKTNKKVTGKIIVKIGVDKEGNVIEAHAGAKGTTIYDTNLWRICEQAARNSKFSEEKDDVGIQYGTITYNFVE